MKNNIKTFLFIVLLISSAMKMIYYVSAEQIIYESEQVEVENAQLQENEEVSAETAIPMIQGVASEIHTHEVAEYAFEFMGTAKAEMKIAVYKAGHKEGDDPETIKTVNFDNDGKVSFKLDLSVCKAGDYEIVYYYTNDKASLQTIPLYIRKSIDVRYNAKIIKLEVANVVYTGFDIDPMVTIVEKANGEEYTLVKDKDYTVEVVSGSTKECGDVRIQISGIGDYTGVLGKMFVIVPQNPSLINVELIGEEGAKVTWEKVENADGYVVERRTINDPSDNQFSRISPVLGKEADRYMDDTLQGGNIYMYCVKAIKNCGRDSIMSLPTESEKTISLCDTQHSWVKIDTKVASCTEKGYIEYRCTRCGHSKKEDIDKLAHIEMSADNAVKATCIRAGKESDIVCASCGQTIKVGKIIPVQEHAHVWNQGLLVNNASYTANGLIIYTCNVCDKTKYELIPQLTREKQTISISKKFRKTITYKTSKLKTKKITLKINAKAHTKLSYKIIKGNKKYITVSKSGIITLKKGCKKGVYKIMVSAEADNQYDKATSTILISVKK